MANGRVDVEGGLIQVAARRPGVIQSVLVEEGERVEAGQILARLDDETARLDESRALATVESAAAELRLAEAATATAQRELERTNALAEQNFVSRQRVEQVRDRLTEAEATAAAKRALQARAQAELELARYDRELMTVRAPVAGRIARRMASPGGGTSTLNVSTLFLIDPDRPRIVRAEITERSLPEVRVGQQADIVPEARPDLTAVGTVVRISPIMGARRLDTDGAGATTDERVVEVVIATDARDLLIGQRVMVRFGPRTEPASPAKGPVGAMEP
jgi:HlyD family secretion protein